MRLELDDYLIIKKDNVALYHRRYDDFGNEYWEFILGKADPERHAEELLRQLFYAANPNYVPDGKKRFKIAR